MQGLLSEGEERKEMRRPGGNEEERNERSRGQAVADWALSPEEEQRVEKTLE